MSPDSTRKSKRLNKISSIDKLDLLKNLEDEKRMLNNKIANLAKQQQKLLLKSKMDNYKSAK